MKKKTGRKKNRKKKLEIKMGVVSVLRAKKRQIEKIKKKQTNRSNPS
tara:strand:+ start:1417 stop:1557 length:141 start_codon:yes stop_codon:yes gene_type:complete